MRPRRNGRIAAELQHWAAMGLIMIRHGEPDINADDLIEPPLTPLGERQAEATAEFLAKVTIDAIYVSPQLRGPANDEAAGGPIRNRSRGRLTDRRVGLRIRHLRSGLGGTRSIISFNEHHWIPTS